MNEIAIGLTGSILKRDPHPLPPRQDGMRVVLNVHGGQQALADVMEGLVQRNMRSIRAGRVPRAPSRVNCTDGVWRDAVTASKDGCVTAGTLAAWRTAEERIYGEDSAARIGFESGRPVYVSGSGAVMGFAGGERVRVPGDRGRTNEYMMLTIDDSTASPVVDINNAIARHNAKQIEAKGLPRLYSGSIRYQTEGSPELWWDAEEIARRGHDDCEGLAAYRAGELINAGHDASVYCRLIEGPASGMGGGSGVRLFHAVTKIRQPDGSVVYDDPSAVLGMPVPRWYMDQSRRRRAAGRSI